MPGACAVSVAVEFMWRSDWKQVRMEGNGCVRIWPTLQSFSALFVAVWASGVHAWFRFVGKGKEGEPRTSQELRRVRKVCMGAG